MVDLEKVIKGLQEAVDWLSTETSLTVVDQWVVRDALALLKAREPIEPVQDMVGDALFWICGKCGHDICSTDWYCSNCGRAVKWE